MISGGDVVGEGGDGQVLSGGLLRSQRKGFAAQINNGQ